jgi:hypothetical protein
MKNILSKTSCSIRVSFCGDRRNDGWIVKYLNITELEVDMQEIEKLLRFQKILEWLDNETK